jgi:hypothetical protein
MWNLQIGTQDTEGSTSSAPFPTDYIRMIYELFKASLNKTQLYFSKFATKNTWEPNIANHCFYECFPDFYILHEKS